MAPQYFLPAQNITAPEPDAASDTLLVAVQEWNCMASSAIPESPPGPVGPSATEKKSRRNKRVGHEPPPGALYLSPRHAADLMDFSLSTLWRHAKNDPRFPRPIKLSAGCTRFDRNELIAYALKCQKVGK